MIKDVIAKLLDGTNLTQKEAYDTMSEIMRGEATASQIAGFLIALRAKKETVDEIAGCALSMRDYSRPLSLKHSNIVDMCGTGGDGKGGLNVSTAASFVAAGAGFVVAKHGNRAISSHCGSADVLEALGVRVDPPIASVEQMINEVGIGFMFAPSYHPAMKHAMPSRKELGVRTVFNVLGPLTNPARANVQLIGVYSPTLLNPIAQVMAKMKHKAGLVVHTNGWDEITLDAPTKACEMTNGKVKAITLTHKNFGLPRVSTKAIAGGDAVYNAGIITSILEGKKIPARNVVVANAAALIWIADRAFGNKKATLVQSVKKAEEAIDSGAALKKLKDMAEVSHSIE